MTPRDWTVAILAVLLCLIIQAVAEYARRLVELWRDPDEPPAGLGLLRGEVTTTLQLDLTEFQADLQAAVGSIRENVDRLVYRDDDQDDVFTGDRIIPGVTVQTEHTLGGEELTFQVPADQQLRTMAGLDDEPPEVQEYLDDEPDTRDHDPNP